VFRFDLNICNAGSYKCSSLFSLNTCRVLWSKPIPLAWYFNPQWERIYGSRWSEQMCNEWITDDRYLENFTAELPPCPYTLDRAVSDKGRFLPDFDCDKDANPSCLYHSGAVHCVRSGLPRWEGSPNCQLFVNNLFLVCLHYQYILKIMTKNVSLGCDKLQSGTLVPMFQVAVWYVGTHVSSGFYPEVGGSILFSKIAGYISDVVLYFRGLKIISCTKY
jgi:hypothetical protein